MSEQRKAREDCSVCSTQSALEYGSDFVFPSETSTLATALDVFDTMLVGPTKFLAKFRITLSPYVQKHSPSNQSIEIGHKTKIAITHPEPIGVCGQMFVTAPGHHGVHSSLK